MNVSVDCIYRTTKITFKKNGGEEGTWRRYLVKVLVEGAPYNN